MERVGFLYLTDSDLGLDPLAEHIQSLDNCQVGTISQNLATYANHSKESKLASCTYIAAQCDATNNEAAILDNVFPLHGRHCLNISLWRNI